MATRMKFEKGDIEVARQRLLEAIYSELPDDRFLKRDAVKQLLSTLIAARERGLAFEKIAEILRQSGLDLPVETLRSYFFELKTDAELAAENVRHAKKVAQTRAAIQNKVLELHTEHGSELAARRARLTQAKPRFVNAFSASESEPVSNPTQQRQEEPRAVKRNLKAENARPASPAAPLPEPAAPEAARLNSEGEGSANAGVASTETAIPTSETATRAAPAIKGENDGVLTLTAIEEASRATEDRTELLDDVELREGDLVYYISGQPFRGLLSQRQIRLLRTVGKIIAPTKSRSSKDFVAMPTKL